MQTSIKDKPALWLTVQWLSVGATGLLIAGLARFPASTLELFWGVVIPLLPATFLVSPLLWRSICPIATLNMVGNGWISRRAIKAASIPKVSSAGIVLFVIAVPARHLLFNENGIALILAIVVVLAAAFVLGAFYDAKSGFCNTLCPVLPIEKLYGQRPLVSMKNPRCATCQLCTPRGCIDLSPQKSIEKVLTPAHRSNAWLKTPMGIFAAALPGFIVGYYTTGNHPWTEAGAVYLYVGGAMLISYTLFAGLVLLLNWNSSRALLAFGAASISLYYAFAATQMATTLHLGSAAAWGIRIGAFLLIGAWLVKAVRAAKIDSPRHMGYTSL